MTTTDELPQGVREALRAGRKLEAIKRLREQRNLGLKEAKDLIDTYLRQHPQRGADQAFREESTGGRLLVIIVLGLLGWLVYRYLT